jgi:hypothetical protein
MPPEKSHEIWCPPITLETFQQVLKVEYPSTNHPILVALFLMIAVGKKKKQSDIYFAYYKALSHSALPYHVTTCN